MQTLQQKWDIFEIINHAENHYSNRALLDDSSAPGIKTFEEEWAK
jgi:hypothetical protein